MVYLCLSQAIPIRAGRIQGGRGGARHGGLVGEAEAVVAWTVDAWPARREVRGSRPDGVENTDAHDAIIHTAHTRVRVIPHSIIPRPTW